MKLTQLTKWYCMLAAFHQCQNWSGKKNSTNNNAKQL